ncbi:MAG: hypothetical protein J5I98_20810 [Phaeodactylibacter sp.]|nr:hypothetical protein [Phaeodactylibacter sp.]
MKKEDIGKLKAELIQFTGTEYYYFNPLFRQFRYTDGVKFLAERAGAYWLLDYIFSNQSHKSLRGQGFQVWKIRVKQDDSATITVEDGNNNVLKRFRLEYTDFPLEEFDLWLIDKVLILPSEY